MEDGEEREWGAKAWTYLSSVRSLSPLIQCITNFVSMDLTANTLLSAGASPAMLHSPNESPDFTPQVNITATGCAVTALIAAFVATDPSHAMEATASALAVFGVAGELGMETARGPASLRTHLIDSLHGLDQTAVISGVKITAI
ncbi:hypothetical protein GOBAR_DD03512 [Gossypium barbadense]|nr:hypothetical protein GOBAR_DD03512 [Gossypium barbadense]